MSKKQPEAQPVAWRATWIGESKRHWDYSTAKPYVSPPDKWRVEPLFASPPMQAEQPQPDAYNRKLRQQLEQEWADLRRMREQAAQQSEPSDEWEVRADGKRVRKDRWEWGFRKIVAMTVGPRTEFEIDDIVEMVRRRFPESEFGVQGEPSDEAIDLLAQQEGLLPDFGDLAEPGGATMYTQIRVTKLRRFARAVLALKPSVPDGWKLVPMEPSEDMLFAAELSRPRGYRDLYAAMLAAAPQQEDKFQQIANAFKGYDGPEISGKASQQGDEK